MFRLPPSLPWAHVRPHRWLGLALGLALWADQAQAQLIPGIEEWAESTIESGKSKWVGQRVPFPTPSPRPLPLESLRSELWPLTVHLSSSADDEQRARAAATLEALEDAYAVLAATGFTAAFGDGGQGGTSDHDFYLLPTPNAGVEARIDASEPVSDLDAARAFALIDTRIPRANLDACAAQALAELIFYELDPAEAPSVRKSSAAYLAYLVTGRMGCDDAAERAEDDAHRAPLDTEPSARGARWLSLLDAREDRKTGVFLREMWQFARQHTWDGPGLRGSPDLMEAIAKGVEINQEKLEDVAAELSITGFLALAEGAIARKQPDPRRALLLADVAWSALPAHVPPAFPAIEPLGSAYVLVRTQGAEPGERLRVWSRGELGVRWALVAAQLDAEGHDLGRVRIPTRDNPNGFLVVELDPRCDSVLVAITNVSDGVPDPDALRGDDVRSVAFMFDR